jgi:replicative DNA helicase
MALSPEEKDRVRYHLGYPSVTAGAAIVMGIPAQRQTAFLVEQAMNLILDVALPRVRQLLMTLDSLEEQMVCAQSNLAAEKLGEMTLRKDQIDSLEKEYQRWAMRLADVMAVPIYPFSTRFKKSGPGNVPVRG